ncbi:hypothetical protein SERLA73DRAFT_75532 [Serpula lacrymans var. lacrymans S7.3]|uniref:CCZ1/INTU/HSP4 first Longin domain-containing protein n=2 Tax=Serpula lacrymans var. lacrymans TaxID=341189 RepID=F8Q528_SERL3|nr:uncharacterized protein SERLADRAFT_440292 [Serpula lacrymans var. lacrymans S7.9]EGN96655.1 hypothetical protein SERLA73DRAFT_75532 [Serpula lacrymans var. lacrymans S7.3]EGO22275.1 hypothetical protein SERLADRAFT_440292 [Serpula lacrymans var. lacrymans S7.9]
MSRTPAALLYMTIYNPSLRPVGPVSPDDEDAEEQAHILFYTSRERAVSRDRMLRQVGLAKALVNFSEIFSSTDSCQNVHSQSKRMVMVNPEPDFWIHAAVELARTPRKPVVNVKNKGKEKEKGKEKQKAEAQEHQIYDYHDGSLHDLVLRGHILRGYELFKLTHGSFTSILSSLGQEALELQLERFFTMWAWSWNLEEGYDLSTDLGLPLHPLHRSFLPLVDTFSSQLPDHIVPLILCPPYLAPSSRFTHSNFPEALSRHLLSLVPPLPPKSIIDTGSEALPPGDAGHVPAANLQKNPHREAYTSSAFLGMPSVNLNLNMDVRKWSWPFSKASKKPLEVDLEVKDNVEKSDNPRMDHSSAGVDTSALQDAMSSDSIHLPLKVKHDPMEGASVVPIECQEVSSEKPIDLPASAQDYVGLHEDYQHQIAASDSFNEVESRRTSQISTYFDDDHPESNDPALCSPESQASTIGARNSDSANLALLEPAPEFLTTSICLVDSPNSSITHRREVAYLRSDDFIVALINSGSSSQELPNLDGIGKEASALLIDIQNVVDEDITTRGSDSLPSASKILQPKDKHLVRSGKFFTASPGFELRSHHLYHAGQLLEKDTEISEVFSRGQNPQHWHVIRGIYSEETSTRDEEIYLEVSRKEASLADVDNVLQKIARLER